MSPTKSANRVVDGTAGWEPSPSELPRFRFQMGNEVGPRLLVKRGRKIQWSENLVDEVLEPFPLCVLVVQAPPLGSGNTPAALTMRPLGNARGNDKLPLIDLYHYIRYNLDKNHCWPQYTRPCVAQT